MAAAEPDANTHNADGKSLSLRRSRSDPKTLLAYIIYPATAKGGRAGRSVVFMVTTDTLRDRQRPAAMFISLCLIPSAPPRTITTTIPSSLTIKYICMYAPRTSRCLYKFWTRHTRKSSYYSTYIIQFQAHSFPDFQFAWY